MSIANKQVSCLQAMGIDVYRRYQEQSEKASLTNKAWFSSLLSLLKITEQDCQFSDALPISYDPINKRLTLPFTIETDDASLKRDIWQQIKGDVEL
jgi:hypothetical protein